jgi:hypothetical protein
MKIEALGAGHGDAIVMRWTGAGGSVRHGLVDGGPAKWYATQLQPNLDSIAAEVGGAPLNLEFVCVSHIDDDHIGGIERLFTAIRRRATEGRPLPAQVRRLWFNGWDRLGMSEAATKTAASDPLVGASVRQGRDLRDIARLLHIDGNAPVRGAFVAGSRFDLDGLSVDVVAPGHTQLQRLLAVWERAEHDLPVFTAAYNDRSIPNLSSIALVVRAEGRSALLAGDARGDHLLEGLAAANLLPHGHLHVDVLKLPHHGSINNVESEFFEALSADHYIVSADGVTHGLPNVDCLDLLLRSRPSGDAFEILLTNPMPAIEQYLAEACAGRPITIVVRALAARGVVA